MLLIHGDLEALETGKDSSVFLQGRLATNINNVSRICDTLDNEVAQQSGPKREIWRIRVKQLVEECKNMRKSMDTYLQSKYAQAREEDERSKLLERRSKGGQTAEVDQLLKENQSLGRSHTVLDDIESAGRNIISSLGSQNETIKKAQRKLWDMANTLGLSRNIIRRIQRRTFVDKLIVYSGMVITLVFIFLLWTYMHSGSSV